MKTSELFKKTKIICSKINMQKINKEQKQDLQMLLDVYSKWTLLELKHSWSKCLWTSLQDKKAIKLAIMIKENKLTLWEKLSNFFKRKREIK